MTLTITNANMTLVEQIKSLIKSFSPAASFSIEDYSESDIETSGKRDAKNSVSIMAEERRKNVDAAFGSLSQYANPELHKMEKNAWEMAMREKHAKTDIN